MTQEQAQACLRAYRPELRDDPAWKDDPQLAQALAALEADPNLRQWWERHCRFDREARRQFQSIPAPTASQPQFPRQPGSRRAWPHTPIPLRRAAWALAAAAALTAAALFLWTGRQPSDDLSFATYRSRMIRNVLREYPMSIFTNALSAVRAHLQERQAPADFEPPAGLASLSLTGAGVLGWRTNAVSMICYDRGDRQMLFLFVVAQSGVPDAPGWPPESSLENRLRTVGWSANGWVYLLAGPREDALMQWLP